MKPLLALLFFVLAAPAIAAGEDRPQDGAIQGGSIVPGEQGGMPEKPSPKAVARCEELQGKLREQCLEQEKQDSGVGASRPARPGPTRPTPDTPPPQNPAKPVPGTD